MSFDILFPFSGRWRLYLGPDVRYSIDINGGYWSPSLFFGARAGIEYFLSDHFFIGIGSSVRVANNKAADPLYSSFTFQFDPVGIKMGVKF